MRNTPINYQIVSNIVEQSGLKPNISSSAIREVVRLVNNIEKATGEKFIRMEMGVPGLKVPDIMINAEIEALKNGVASVYPNIEGDEELKNQMSRFIKLFANIDIPPECCVPSVGAMQGALSLFLVASRLWKERSKILFIDPGFPVQKQQCVVLGIPYETFDVYGYRGDKLKEKIESYFKTNEFAAVIYSNPNNPSWISFNEKELEIIGTLATKYDVIVLEDLAYFGMDYRVDYSKPGVEPYQPTVARYTDNYIILFSSSKIFSFAGERVGTINVSPKLFNKRFPDLLRNFKKDIFGYALIYGSLYVSSAGVNHSAQKALAAILKASNDGDFNFVEYSKEYGERSKVIKKMMIENGFKIVYEMDEDEPVGNGFYYTFSYPRLSGDELLEELLYYGISAISLKITGSEHTEGMRGCVSQILPNQFETLRYRLEKFHEDHK